MSGSIKTTHVYVFKAKDRHLFILYDHLTVGESLSCSVEIFINIVQSLVPFLKVSPLVLVK